MPTSPDLRVADRRTLRRALLVALALLIVLPVLGATAPPARRALAIGEGIFSLDKTTYAAIEGTAVAVVVNRSSGALLTQDVVATVQLSGGTVGVDYPNETVTQTVTFKAGTNPTSAGPIYFQTLNQARQRDVQVTITLISVSNGGQIVPPHITPFTIQGRGSPIVEAISPKSGGAGTTVTVQGKNFNVLGSTPTPYVNKITFVDLLNGPVGVVAGAVPGCELLNPGRWTVVNPTVISLQVAPPSPANWNCTDGSPGLVSGRRYDIRVQLIIPPPVGSTAAPQFSLSAAVAADVFAYTDGPTITSIIPNQGPASGGTTVTIQGTGVTTCTGLTVAFGSVPMFGGSCLILPGSTAERSLFRVVTPQVNPGVVDAVVYVGLPPPAPTLPACPAVPAAGFGCSPTTADTKFTFTGGPVITAVNPSAGTTLGGTPITITGTGFTGVNCNPGAGTIGVTVGGRPVTSCTVLTSTSITAVTPAHSGVQQISVTHPLSGTSPFTTAANFTYVDGPVILSLGPAIGPAAGGTIVTIAGSGFAANATVSFGATPALSILFDSPTQLRATSPAGTGTVDVIVNVSGALSPNTPADDFTYSGPAVTGVQPNSGPIAGGTLVTITGTNFVTSSTVQFGDIPPVPVTFVSPTTITVISPKSVAARTVDLIVTTPSGISLANEKDKFTYTDGPIVTAIDPKIGPSTGGTIVIIVGTGFPPPAPAPCNAVVTFGGNQAPAVNCNSTTQLTVLAPPSSAPPAGSSGSNPFLVDVLVQVATNTSPANDAAKFTYQPQPPVITQVTPDSAPSIGGTSVTITGVGFLGVACPDGVHFGTVRASSCIVSGDTTITAIAPPNVPGPTFIGITTAAGTNAIVPNFTYTASSGGGTPGTPGTPTTPSAQAPAGVQVLTLPPGAGAPVLTRLTAGWTPLIWRGPNAQPLPEVLGDAAARITAIFTWDAERSRWLAWYSGNGAVPGGNDFSALHRGVLYWIRTSPGDPVALLTTDSS